MGVTVLRAHDPRREHKGMALDPVRAAARNSNRRSRSSLTQQARTVLARIGVKLLTQCVKGLQLPHKTSYRKQEAELARPGW